MSGPTCSTCRFYRDGIYRYGTCYLKPPVVFLWRFTPGQTPTYESVRPQVVADDFCGSHSVAEPDAAFLRTAGDPPVYSDTEVFTLPEGFVSVRTNQALMKVTQGDDDELVAIGGTTKVHIDADADDQYYVRTRLDFGPAVTCARQENP